MRSARSLLLETAIVTTVGVLFALAANALSPRGLRIARNYFPAPPGPVHQVNTGASSTAGQGSGRAAADPIEATRQRLQLRGLQLIERGDVAELFRDARYEQGLVVFIDARDDQHYQAGHIPGAWQFNHYRAEQFLPSVLPACVNAEKVVVYCSGGACEDSEFAAIMLRDSGIPREILFIYAGGITEWTNNRLPVEAGARGSGRLSSSSP